MENFKYQEKKPAEHLTAYRLQQLLLKEIALFNKNCFISLFILFDALLMKYRATQISFFLCGALHNL